MKWGDDDDDYLPPREVHGPNADGIKTVIEYKFNDSKQRVKVVTKIRVMTNTIRVSAEMEERKKWIKFGHAEGCEGLDPATTQTSFEVISIDDPDAEETKDDAMKLIDNLASGTGGFSSKWRMRREAGEEAELPPDGEDEEGGGSSHLKLAAGSKYVPPSMRAGGSAAGGKGMSMDSRNDDCTLRVTNISEETCEADLRELFGNFGRIARCYVGKDRETGRSRGFAFISFHSRSDAERAKDNLHGHGFDHLILCIDWAKPSTRDPGAEAPQFRSGYGEKLAQDTTMAATTFSQHS